MTLMLSIVEIELSNKKYMQMEDPREEILRDVKQYATMQQTEDALPAPEAP